MDKPDCVLPLTYTQRDILRDMADEWADKDRHGELASGWGYDDGDREEFSALFKAIRELGRR